MKCVSLRLSAEARNMELVTTSRLRRAAALYTREAFILERKKELGVVFLRWQHDRTRPCCRFFRIFSALDQPPYCEELTKFRCSA